MEHPRHTQIDLTEPYPIDDLCRLLGVSRRTAQRYRTGRAAAPPAALTLLALHSEGRIIPKHWPARTTTRDTLTAGAYEMRPNELEHYGWLKQQYDRAMATVTAIERKLAYIMDCIPMPERLELIGGRRHLMNIITERDNPRRPTLPVKLWHRADGC